MSDLSAALHRGVQDQEREQLTGWLDTFTSQPPAPLPPKPVLEPAPAPKNSVLKSAARAAYESANHGAGQVLDGLWDIVSYTPPDPSDVGRGAAIETVSSFGPKFKAVKKIVDGVMGLAMAPGVAVGTGLTTMLQNMSPEMAARVAVPGGPGGMAPLVRALLGQPAFSGTTEQRQQLQAPMTVAEVVEVAGTLGGAIATGRVLSRKGKAAEKPAPTTGEAVAAGETAPVPVDTAATMAEANQRGLDVTRLGHLTLEDAIAAAETEVAAELRTAPSVKTKPEPAKPVASVADVAREVGELDPMADVDALHKFVKSQGGLAPSPTGDLAGEYSVVPKALKNRKGLDPAAMAEAVSEHVGRQVGDAELLDLLSKSERLKAEKGQRLAAVEAPPEAVIPTETAIRMDRPPADVMDLFHPGEWERMPESLRLSTLERMRGGAEREWGDIVSTFGNEAGAIDAGILARIAIGGLLGGATGDTPEEAIRNALGGAGLGLLMRRGMAAKIAARLKSEMDPAMAVRAAGRGKPVPAPGQISEGAGYQPNYGRIQADPQTVSYMKSMHEGLRDEIIAQKRGVRGHEVTEAAARDLISSGRMTTERILELEPGAVLNAEEATAARMLNVALANRAATLSTRLLAGDPMPAGDVTRAAVISGEVAKRVRAMSGETGRALSAHTITVGESVVNPARLADRLAEVGNVSERALAEIIVDSKTPEKIATFTRIMTAIPGAVLEALYGAMLSGKALVKNAVGNSLMMPVAAWERTLAQVMPTWGKSAGRVLPGEGAQAFHGLWEGLTDHWRMLTKLDREAYATEIAEMGQGKMEQHGPRITAAAFNAEGTSLAPLIDFTGKVVRAPLEVLNATDAMSKAVNGRMAIRWESFRQASREGLVDEAFTRRLDELANNPGLLSEEARVRIADFREQQTFTKDFEGRILSAIQTGPQFGSEVGTAWAQLAYRWTAATFVRTPLRIAEAGALRTPGLNLLMSQFWRDWNAGGAQRQVAQARLLTGTAVIGTFGYLASEGLITGSAPKNPAHRKSWENAGYQEKSFWDPITGQWRSYDGFEPLTTLVATGADIAHGMRLAPELEWETVIVASAMAQLDNLDAKSYTQGVSEFIDMVKNPSDASRIENGFAFVRKKLAMFSPAILREIESGIDPAVRRARPGSEPNTVLREAQVLRDSYLAKTPFFSASVPAERNMINGEVIVGESWPYNPWVAKTPKTGIVWTELMRLRGAGLEPLPEWIGQRPVADVGLDQPKPVAVRLSPQQRDRWVVLMTQEAKDGQGRTLYDNLRDLVGNRDYVQQSEVRQRELIQQRYSAYRDLGEKLLRKEDPDVRGRLQRQEIQRKVQRVPTMQQPNAQKLLETLMGTMGR